MNWIEYNCRIARVSYRVVFWTAQGAYGLIYSVRKDRQLINFDRPTVKSFDLPMELPK